MIANDNPIHPILHRQQRVLHALYPLQHDRALPIIAEELEHPPRLEHTRVRLREPGHAELGAFDRGGVACVVRVSIWFEEAVGRVVCDGSDGIRKNSPSARFLSIASGSNGNA